ncbi:MAG TPA: hypothetical protein DF427_04020 [Moraxellaceae bacterium]|nr:hypothetical protein [Moraxellaceae bacterium]
MRHCPLQRMAKIVLHGLIGLLAATGVHAENTEADIKAAFIYNFAKFVEWPEGTFADSKDRLLLCTQGDTVLARKLRLLAGREAQGRTIEVRPLAGAEAISGCHILLTPSSGEALGHSATLTISESTGTARPNSMINLFVDANRVQFSVNLPATQQAGIKVSARLLQLARTVNKGG